MSFLLQRILRRAGADNSDALCIYLGDLVSSLNNSSLDFERAAELERVLKIYARLLINNYLYMLERCAVIKLDKRYVFRISRCSHPAADRDSRIQQRLVSKNFLDVNVLHKTLPPYDCLF